MPKSILLVEDNPKDLEFALLALKKSRLANEVVVARDGEEALDYMFRQGKFADLPVVHPAVVLLDLKMPKVDGLQVLERFKSNENTKNVPVVMLTASREESDLTQSYKLGANAFVVKPIDFKEFIAAIQELGTFWAVLNEPPLGSAKARI